DPDRGADLLLDRDALDGAAELSHAAALRARLLRHPADRWTHWTDAGLGAARSAGHRHVFRRRPSALCADRWRGIPAVRRVLLLVPEGEWPYAERAARPVAVLALLHRLQCVVLADASPGVG